VQTGAEKKYALTRDEWSIHFTNSWSYLRCDGADRDRWLAKDGCGSTFYAFVIDEIGTIGSNEES
jgi:hypothetical protein